MAKPSKPSHPNRHKPTKSTSHSSQPQQHKSKSKLKNTKQMQDDQVDDIMAWGKSKQNYYKQSQQQYSQASQQQDQAQQIYQNQYQQLNRDQFYQVPQEEQKQKGKKNDNADIDEQEQQQQAEGINQQYIDSQILWVTELAKMFEGIHDDQYQFRKKVYDSYLLILITLKSYKISYIDQHPLVQNLPVLKKALQHFQRQLPKLYEKYGQGQEKDQRMDQTQEGLEEEGEGDQFIEDQSEQVSTKKNKKINKEGLQAYERIKNQKMQAKKQKKLEKKSQIQQSKPKQPFRLVTQHEGRLANEKILKNKVLMKRRRRDDGNSRTKLRHKYEKALVRRKAKGFTGVKENPGRYYEGENKILYGKIASTKLK